jgi:TRAP-type C4-dicarboxylate transport system permease small subunit
MLSRGIERLARYGVRLGGLAFIGVSLLVCLEVVLREVFRIGLGAASEVSAYVMAISAAWGFSFTLLNRAHVRVDAAILHLPKAVQAAFDVLALIVMSWLATSFVYFGWGVFEFSWVRNAHSMTPLQTPLWLPQGLWLLGMSLFMATSLLLTARCLRHLLRGEIDEVRAIAGTLSAFEEAEGEVKLAQADYAAKLGKLR